MESDSGNMVENLQFLGATLGTVVLGSWAMKRLTTHLHDSLLTKVRINAAMRLHNYHEDDRLYHYLLRFLGKYMDENYQNRTVTVVTKRLEKGKEEDEYISPPGYGVHYIQYQGCWIRIERLQIPKTSIEGMPMDSIILSTYKWNRHVLYNLIKEANDSQIPVQDEKKTTFYILGCGGYWECFGLPKARRPLESVITAGKIKEELRNDINEFLDCESWYTERGIPFRRGYLLYGPPGTGKSSLIRAIAGDIGYDVCILSLSSKELTDDQLNKAMNSTPEKCIILLEDIDAAFKSREDGESNGLSTIAYEGSSGSSVTFRGLLNALDGVASTEGRIMFLTTNYIDKLDPALIRPGRVDVRIHIGYPTSSQVVKMFRRFYPNAETEVVTQFLNTLKTMDKKISMAEIQGLFLVFKEDPEKAIKHAQEYFNHKYFGEVKDTFSADEEGDDLIELEDDSNGDSDKGTEERKP